MSPSCHHHFRPVAPRPPCPQATSARRPLPIAHPRHRYLKLDGQAGVCQTPVPPQVAGICRRRSTRPAGTRWSAPRPPPVRPRPEAQQDAMIITSTGYFLLPPLRWCPPTSLVQTYNPTYNNNNNDLPSGDGGFLTSPPPPSAPGGGPRRHAAAWRQYHQHPGLPPIILAPLPCPASLRLPLSPLLAFEIASVSAAGLERFPPLAIRAAAASARAGGVLPPLLLPLPAVVGFDGCG